MYLIPLLTGHTKMGLQAKLRVMVWIHGGFLQFGSSHQTGLSPSAKLAKKLDTVFVSLNYRLHALGFLSLNPVTNLEQGTDYRKTSINGTSKRSLGDERLTGNFGIWDQVMALTWVQQNIISFGGDPERVTVFGPDSTGATIMAMMSNQGVSQSLFQSAWIMDPAVFMNKSMDEVSRKAQDSFFLRSGCDSLSCLRSLSPESVTKIFLGNDDPSFRINDQNDLPIQGIFPQQLIVIDGMSHESCLCSCKLLPVPFTCSLLGFSRFPFPVPQLSDRFHDLNFGAVFLTRPFPD